MTHTMFECPNCHEAIEYDPPNDIKREKRIFELGPGLVDRGKTSKTVIDCPHCLANLILEQENGSAELSSEYIEQAGNDSKLDGIFYDASFAQIQIKVTSLNAEGSELNGKGEYEKAVAKFLEAVNLSKHDPISWYNLGVALANAGRSSEAVQAFEESVACDASNISALNNIGMTLIELDQLSEAEHYFDKAISLDPNYKKAYVGKGNVSLLRGDVKTARRFFKQALKIDPNYEIARLSLQQLGR